jgi:formate transporter
MKVRRKPWLNCANFAVDEIASRTPLELRSTPMDMRSTQNLPAQPTSGAKAAEVPQVVTFDAILPSAMAVRAEETGVRKARADPLTVLVLSLLGGAFISFGAIFATTVSAGSISIASGDGATAFIATPPYGIMRLLSGLVFSLGLLLIVIAGAELFTGNNLIVMAWASGKVRTTDLLANWTIVFVGNCCGALATAVLMFCTTQYTFGRGAVGLAALSSANSKAALAFVPALALGVMCNALVCLAIWMSYSARTTVDRVVAVAPPVAAFVAAGFEHSIANVYYLAVGLLIRAGAGEAFWASIGKTAADFPDLTWQNSLANLVPVTIGNAVGGALMVGLIYWFVYLRPAVLARPPAVTSQMKK